MSASRSQKALVRGASVSRAIMTIIHIAARMAPP